MFMFSRNDEENLNWRKEVQSGEKASLRIQVQNDKKECIFSVTFVSNRSYEEALQEAIALGQRLLKNEAHAIRVEIRDERAHSKKPRVVLTRDDIPHVDNKMYSSWVQRVLKNIIKYKVNR
jgi:hypothetical protein